MQTRLYIVVDKDDTKSKARLIEASNAAQAVRHVVSARYDASVAKSKEVAELMANGTKVEKASAAE